MKLESQWVPKAIRSTITASNGTTVTHMSTLRRTTAEASRKTPRKGAYQRMEIDQTQEHQRLSLQKRHGVPDHQLRRVPDDRAKIPDRGKENVGDQCEDESTQRQHDAAHERASRRPWRRRRPAGTSRTGCCGLSAPRTDSRAGRSSAAESSRGTAGWSVPTAPGQTRWSCSADSATRTNRWHRS